MLTEYIQKALEKAHYEMIEDDEPFYGEIPGLDGLWATGPTLESCRAELSKALEDWLLFSIAKGLPVPPMDGLRIESPETVES
jgi:predicted RNase H-like HicB family nuclease